MKIKLLTESELKKIRSSCEDSLLMVEYERRNRRTLSYSNRMLEMMSLSTLNIINDLVYQGLYIKEGINNEKKQNG